MTLTKSDISYRSDGKYNIWRKGNEVNLKSELINYSSEWVIVAVVDTHHEGILYIDDVHNADDDVQNADADAHQVLMEMHFSETGV